MTRCPILALVLVAAALSACPPEPPLGSRVEHMDRLAAAFTSALLACEPRPAFEALVEPDDPRDPARLEAGYRAWFRLLFEDEHVRVDQAAFAGCLAFLESDARCDGFGDDDVEGDCDRIFSGTLAGGQRCGADEQCESELCLFGGSSPCGSCAEDDVGREGEFCGIRACADGLFCQYGHPDGAVCARLRAEGEACFEDVAGTRVFFRCARGLYCASDDACRPEGEEGDACDDATRCASALVCKDARCEEPLVGEAEGDPCDPEGEGCGRTLETGLACEGPPGDAVCVRAVVVAEGDACDGGNDDDERAASRWCARALTTHRCALDEGAAEGVCVRRVALADACDDDRTCDREQGGCVVEEEGATCRAWPEPGERCLVVNGAPTCGPAQSCVRGPEGARCAEHPFPTSLPRCG